MPDLTSPEARIAELGLSLPEPTTPVASYVPARRVGNLVYISGQIPLRDGTLIAQGTVPGQVSVETARDCAVQCALNGLAALKGEIGSLDNVKSLVRLGGWVASEPGFNGQPGVINGASDLMIEVFGEAGRHARAAVGSVDLPLGVPVEIEFLFEVE